MMTVDPVINPHADSFSLPPAARTHSLLGELRPFQDNPLTYLVRLSREVGNVARFRAGFWDIYLVAHPDAISELLVAQHTALSKNTFTNQILRTVAGDGLLTMEGEAWRERRQLLQPLFGRNQMVEFAKIVTLVTQARIEKWQTFVDHASDLDVGREMSALALEIACKAFFDIDIADSQEEIRNALNTLSEVFVQRTRSRLAALWGLFGFPAFGQQRLHAATQALDSISLSIVSQLRSRQPLADTPLSDVARTLSEREFCAEVRTLLVAGHETTAKALTWALYLLSQYPEIADRLAQSADDPADASDQHYSQQVAEEVLRLYPPAWTMSRRAEQELIVGGYRIPKGARIMISPYVTHRLPAFWPDPERFDPERHTAKQKEHRHAYALIPFGAGGHQCIGRRFALQEMQLILPMIVQQFHLSLASVPPILPAPQNTLTPTPSVLLQIRRQ